ncbi:MAG: M67 family metallopeptidase [Anaerolineales bacterium]|nr:M67 family metallopeptidase [Anaerolineales bacterium]
MSSLLIPAELLEELSVHLAAAYPDEGAGFLFGQIVGEVRRVQEILPLPNAREAEARHNRFLITPQDYAQAEQRAARSGLDVIGVFHSHPDSPNVPSEFDRQWALPYFVYLITIVTQGKVESHRVWLLREDRSAFDEITLEIIPSALLERSGKQ